MEHKPFTNQDIGINGVVPNGWVEAEPSVWLRRSTETDPTHLVQQRIGGLDRDEILALGISAESLDTLPGHAGVIESPNMTWDWYLGQASAPTPKDELVVYLALVGKVNET